MPRTREISPGFFRNEDLHALGPYHALFFAGLWDWADREGRLEDRPVRLRADILPYYPEANGEELMAGLAKAGFVKRYEVDGQRLVWVVNFEDYQHPHPREVESELPAHPEDTKPDYVRPVKYGGPADGKGPQLLRKERATCQQPASNLPGSESQGTSRAFSSFPSQSSYPKEDLSHAGAREASPTPSQPKAQVFTHPTAQAANDAPGSPMALAAGGETEPDLKPRPTPKAHPGSLSGMANQQPPEWLEFEPSAPPRTQRRPAAPAAKPERQTYPESTLPRVREKYLALRARCPAIADWDEDLVDGGTWTLWDADAQALPLDGPRGWDGVMDAIAASAWARGGGASPTWLFARPPPTSPRSRVACWRASTAR
jgi:hypothetical protein